MFLSIEAKNGLKRRQKTLRINIAENKGILIRTLYLAIIVFLFLGCGYKYIDNSSDLDTFQFIITFSSNNVVLLREAAEKYDQKADIIRKNTNQNYLDNSLYYQCRQWANLLNQKADMVEAGHFEQ